jgi:hypothetical protein
VLIRGLVVVCSQLEIELLWLGWSMLLQRCRRLVYVACC